MGKAAPATQHLCSYAASCLCLSPTLTLSLLLSFSRSFSLFPAPFCLMLGTESRHVCQSWTNREKQAENERRERALGSASGSVSARHSASHAGRRGAARTYVQPLTPATVAEQQYV